MKPKTKLQNRVVELQAKLPTISNRKKQYAFDKCFEHSIYYTKTGGAVCMECGENFALDFLPTKKMRCPKCGKNLKVEYTRRQKKSMYSFFTVIETFEGFQLVRIFDVLQNYRKGKKANYAITEIVQHWITIAGKYETFARLRVVGYASDNWSWSSSLELREGRPHHNLNTRIVYPGRQVVKTIKRNGFKQGLYGIAPLDLFTGLLKNSKIETLLKAGFTRELSYFMEDSYGLIKLEHYWNVLKICIRNNYRIKDVGIWIDYLKLLEHFGRDIHNAYYVCPENLHRSHNKLVEKKQQEDRLLEVEERKRKARKDERKFKRLKGKFLGVSFSEKELQIVTLDSVAEYIQEGELLHHCVFVNDYHLKKNTLVLSARIDGVPIETIEVSLKNYKVLQSRGKFNQNSSYHERILQLVKANVHLIKRRAKRVKILKTKQHSVAV